MSLDNKKYFYKGLTSSREAALVLKYKDTGLLESLHSEPISNRKFISIFPGQDFKNIFEADVISFRTQ